MTWEADGGGSEASKLPQSDVDAARTSCNAETDCDSLERIYETVSRNPENKDTVPDLVACLVRHGMADPSLTAEEYKQIVDDPDRDEEVFGRYFDSSREDYDSEKSQEYWQCQSDPRQ